MAQPAGKVYHSGHLLLLARQCYNRISPGHESESQIVMIMAAVALEAFLNELEHNAEWAMGLQASQGASNLARVLAQAERGKASLLLKIDLTHLVMTGTLPDRGTQPYQDIQLLISLRNLLVHAGPEELYRAEEGETPEYPKIVRSFVSRGVIRQPTNPAIGWTQYVLVPAVAGWAHNTVVAAMQWIASLSAREALLNTVLTQVTSGLPRIGTSHELPPPGGALILEISQPDKEP
jgi:hypothetical protein